MEKAILKTLIYADIFDYPLKIWEIHRWLIGKKLSLRQVDKVLNRLLQNGKCQLKQDYYFLPKKERLVSRRKNRQKQSNKYLIKAKYLSQILKIVPWIKLAGVSGGLAMENAAKFHDIDLFIITNKNRLWVSRLFILILLSLLGQRRKRTKEYHLAGKLCVNTLLEEDSLEQKNRDIFVAHEVLQMKVLWQRDGIYRKYLEDNLWAFKFLPNWVDSSKVSGRYHVLSMMRFPIIHITLNLLETWAKKFQLWYMKKPQGMERIEDGALYFHPNDIRSKILKLYRQKTGTS